MSTPSKLSRKYELDPIGFVTDPTAYVVRLYPATNQPPELVFVPVLKNGQEAGRWQNRWLTDEQYHQLVDSIHQLIAPSPVCALQSPPDQAQSAAAGDRDLGGRGEGEVS